MRFIFVLLSFVTSMFAVVTIAPVEIGNDPGVSGSVELSIANARGNTDKDEYKGGVKVQYDNNSSYVTWAQASANYAEVDGKKNTNKTYMHLRYIHTFYKQKDLIYELFGQSQTNEFTKVENRFLLGGGYRYHLLDELMGKVYLGAGAFYEHINYTTQIDEQENNLRANLYLSYTNQFGDDAKLSYIGYYQPKFSSFSDYIITNTVELEVHVYKKLFISLQVNYDYDSKPAREVKKDDFTQTTSLVYKF
ncbi:MAG: DUF481 domain-containing protein [Sulfurimonas sp.]